MGAGSPVGPAAATGRSWALRAAVGALLALGVVKAAAAADGAMIVATGAAWRGAGPGLAAAAGRHPLAVGTAVVVWYGGNAAIAFALAWGLARRRRWAEWVAVLYGAAHVFGFAGLMLLGPIVLLNGILGIVIAVLTLVAGSRGAFQPQATDAPETSGTPSG